MAVLSGTIHDAAASSDAGIAMCASKTTGALRLLRSGSCQVDEEHVMFGQKEPSMRKGGTGGFTAVSATTTVPSLTTAV